MLANFEMLESLPFFQQWSKTQLRKILPSFNIIEATRGQIIVQEGSLSDSIYIVRKGSFSGFRSFKTVVKPTVGQQTESYKQFMDSNRNKLRRNLRGIMNMKICSLTKVNQIT